MMKEIELFEMYDQEAQRKKREEMKKNNMFHELDLKNKKIEDRNRRINNFKKFNIYSGLAIITVASAIALKKYSDYLEKPIQIVTYDIMANEGFVITDDGKSVPAKKFSLEDEDKLYEYMKDKNLTSDEIKKSIADYAKSKGFNENLVLSKVKQDYPELFPIDEIHKTR